MYVRLWTALCTYFANNEPYLDWEMVFCYDGEEFRVTGSSEANKDTRNIEGLLADAWQQAWTAFKVRYDRYVAALRWLRDWDPPRSKTVRHADLQTRDVLVADMGYYILLIEDGDDTYAICTNLEHGSPLAGDIVDHLMVDRTTKKDVYFRLGDGKYAKLRNAVSGQPNLTAWRKLL